MKKEYVIHPFLFAVYPILFLFSHNISQTSPSEILLPLTIVLIFTLLVMVLLKLTLKETNKAGIVTSIFLALFFSYGHIYNLGLNWHIGHFFIGRHRWLMLIWVMFFTCCSYFTARTRRDLRNFTNILNVIASFLVISSLFNIGIYKFNKSRIKQENHVSMQEQKPVMTYLESAGELPDIYYIILDGYASSNVLKEIYDYDNHEFIDYLTEKGFYVVSDSRSNYVMTSLSLASSLNMEYVNYLSDTVGEDSKDQGRVFRMIKNSKVMNFLRSRGYKFIHFSSTCGAMERNRYADLDIRCRREINEFQIALLQTTMLSPFHSNFISKLLRKKVLFAFSKLAEIHRTEGPKFIFAHILIPHPPFLFDTEGEPVSVNILKMGGLVWTQKEKYVDQLIFVNKKVEMLVDEILAKSKLPPIIVLQADHGPSALLSNGVFDGWHRPSENMLKERMGILNAYYLPQGGNDLLYESITPVNTFRLIFNRYFGTNYQLLDDQNYFSNYDQPYKFVNVTDRIERN